MIRIQTATIDDFDEIMKIETACFGEDRFNRRQMKYLLCKARSSNWMAHSCTDSIGYCIGLLPSLPRPSRLYSIAVLPKFRGRGIAALLLERFLADSVHSGHASARLEVSVTNVNAISLYERFGFSTIKYLQGYYHGDVDALRMEWYAVSDLAKSVKS